MLFSRELAMQAVHMCEPSIRNQMEAGRFKRKCLSIVVLDPRMPPGSIDVHAFATGAVSYVHTIGDPGECSRFSEFAKAKAKLSWMHRMSTSVLQQCHPHLIPDRGLLYYGSVWRDGLVVAASGVQPFFDEMVSGWVADAIHALCMEARQDPALGDLAYLPK